MCGKRPSMCGKRPGMCPSMHQKEVIFSTAPRLALFALLRPFLVHEFGPRTWRFNSRARLRVGLAPALGRV